ncbi:hypothetical protein [Bradyrhizobium sp. B117]|uniref:hypothetical protein n=1 Tax=Bradyrhizobium sp. B117 TaxID=3140246 RepID=UPI003183D8ED
MLSFIFTGSVKVAGSIAGAEAITKNDPLLSSRKSLVRHSLGPARSNRWRVQLNLIRASAHCARATSAYLAVGGASVDRHK